MGAELSLYWLSEDVDWLLRRGPVPEGLSWGLVACPVHQEAASRLGREWARELTARAGVSADAAAGHGATVAGWWLAPGNDEDTTMAERMFCWARAVGLPAFCAAEAVRALSRADLHTASRLTRR